MKSKLATVTVLPLWERPKKIPARTLVVSTVSAANPGLSPFHLGPCKLYGRRYAFVMENAWQYSKVYGEHWNELRERPKDSYFEWARIGWNDTKPHRYPMGKGRKPVCSWWDGKPLNYIEARKTIYGPLYAEQVLQSKAYTQLQTAMKEYRHIVLLDYDAYDHRKMGCTLTQVLNNPTLKMGHAFVLAMLLTNDPALELMKLR